MKWLWVKLQDACIEDIERRPVMLFGRQLNFLGRIPLCYDHITWKVGFEKNLLISLMVLSGLSAMYVSYYGEYEPLVVFIFCIVVAVVQYIRRGRQGWSR